LNEALGHGIGIDPNGSTVALNHGIDIDPHGSAGAC